MHIHPYLYFDGRCDEAIEFYKTALGAQVQFLLRFKDMPGPAPSKPFPLEMLDKVMHATLTIGDPFHPANVNRLRAIGIGLAALEALNLFGRMLINWQIPGAVRGAPIDVTAWFSVLVVFVLAEVFREGARLRREAELTI